MWKKDAQNRKFFENDYIGAKRSVITTAIATGRRIHQSGINNHLETAVCDIPTGEMYCNPTPLALC